MAPGHPISTMSRKYIIYGSNGISGYKINYIWQHKQWPNFVFDSEKLSALAYQYAKQTAKLSGSLLQTDLNDALTAQLDSMVDEAINTSLIEGENLNPASVRSSLQLLLNPKQVLYFTPTPINVADAKAEGLAALIVDVRKNFHKPLSKELLFIWHQMVLVGFEDSILNSDLTTGQWRNSPLDDGNGRIGRAIIKYALAQDLGAPVLFSISTHIEKNKKAYYQHLNQASCWDVSEFIDSTALDITP